MRKATMCSRIRDLERALESAPGSAALPDHVNLCKQQGQIFAVRCELRSMLCALRGWCLECRLKEVDTLEMSTFGEAL